MRCKDFEQHWEEWLRGGAPPELAEHLKLCPFCREQAVELERTAAWLASLREEPALPGSAFWARLRQRLEAEERAGDLWVSLNWVAARAALALAAFAFFLTLGVLLEPPAAVADFDAPRTYLDETAGVAVANGQLNRDQVVLTLVAYQEPQQ